MKYLRNRLIYYAKILFIFSLFVLMYLCFPYAETYLKQIDAEKILAASQFRDKKFSIPVQEIKAADISAYLLQENSVPIVSIAFRFTNAGEAHENDDKAGLTDLLTSLLLDGAGKYDEQTFKDTCEEFGIKIAFSADIDDISGHLHFPRQNSETALEMLSAVLRKPHFKEKFIKLRKEQIKTAIKIGMENPQNVLADKFTEFFFAGHPYSRTQDEKLATIDNVTADDLKDFMQTHLSKENLIVGFAGDISVKEAENILQTVFAKLPDSYSGDKISAINIDFSGRTDNISRQTAQASSIFATNAVRRNDADFYPLYMVNYIFGGGSLNSRISQLIREKEGLTYGIYTALVETDAEAMIKGSYSSTPENFTKAHDLLLSEWQKMHENGVSEAELEQAKSSLISSYNLRFASISGIASMLVGMQKYNLGKDFLEKRNDYIKSVTLSEANAAAKKYFSRIPGFVNIGTYNKEEKKDNVRK